MAGGALGSYCSPTAQKKKPRTACPETHQSPPDGIQALGGGPGEPSSRSGLSERARLCLGKGADTAAWMAAAQAELAAAGGYDAFAAYIDCEKCYDHISLSDLTFQGCLQGMGRLVSLAAAQHTGSATFAGRVPCPGQSILPTVYLPGAHWPTGCSTCSCSGP